MRAEERGADCAWRTSEKGHLCPFTEERTLHWCLKDTDMGARLVGGPSGPVALMQKECVEGEDRDTAGRSQERPG